MSMYIAHGKTNYFKVDDVEEFKQALSDHMVTVVDGDDGTVCVLCDSENGWPTYHEDPETGEEHELNLFSGGIIGEHLSDDWVCVVMEVGHEKLRTIGAYAIAFNNKDEEEVLNLDSIYTLAEMLGDNVGSVNNY